MNSIEQISKWCNGNWIMSTDKSSAIGNISIDSRNIDQPDQTLFVALTTKLRDGHNFIADARKKGVTNFLTDRNIDSTNLNGTNIIQVKDTLVALQQIATAHRKQFNIPIIGITGSNGKTIIKEWLSQLLSGKYHIVRNPKSYNSQIGVPLSAWMINENHQLGIFEAGISQPGEMENLERIIQPTIGLFTNIGDAHSEGFLNSRQKINEKLILFKNVQQLVYCLDHSELKECIVQYAHQVRGGNPDNKLELFTWSQKHDADLRIRDIQSVDGKTIIAGQYKGKEQSITIPFSDGASVENAIQSWCILLLLGMSNKDIKAGMLLLQPVSMRMELRHGINDCTIINDTYNSDLTSLQIALNFLDQQKQHSLHTVIMSDIMQPGKRDLDLYDEVAGAVYRRNIQRFIGIGPALYKNKEAFRKHKKLRSIFFKSTEQFLKNFHMLTFDKEAILLKGARAFAFEKISVLLEQKVHQTVMSIDLSALKKNLDVFRAELKPGVKTMAMVKAFAYGSGSYEIANTLEYSGVDYLAVAYTDEGIALRKAGIKLPIMVMSPDESSFDRMIAWKLEPEVYNFRSLYSFISIAFAFQVADYPIHIKLDTGMHRLGFGDKDITLLSNVLNSRPEIKIASIFSHLAASDNPAHDSFTQKQASSFELLSEKIIKQLNYQPLRHLCNSAAIVRHKKMQYEMVRLGLGLHGIDSCKETQEQLEPISTLKTSIAQIHHISAGDNIGYGNITFAAQPMKIATLSIGYADGYPRAMGRGKAYVVINGQRAYTVGAICMDMCMVDVTGIENLSEGDEAEVFGPNVPVTQLAKWADTIPYEILTGISQRVKRIYINEN